MNAAKERALLRATIDEQAFAQNSLDEARRASAHATAKWSECNSMVGELTRQLADAEEEESASSSDRFIAELAGGGDVIETSRVDELRKALADGERESDLWRSARKTSEQAVESRLHALDMARDRVERAARAVADKEVDVSALLASAEVARQKVLGELSTLALVAKMLPQASIGRQSIESFMARGWCAPQHIENAAHDERFSDWFDALKVDADTVLKK
jgi:hypothetical protein